VDLPADLLLLLLCWVQPAEVQNTALAMALMHADVPTLLLSA
jgi:hypothetical protein